MPRKANPLRPGHLRAARERLGLKRYRMGELAGFTSNREKMIWNIEHGKSRQNEPRVVAALLRVIEERRAERWLIGHRKRELAEDQARIARQEALWNAVPESPEKAALLDAMIDRCFDLMCVGDGEMCDAIAEWLPPDRVQAMFAAWERWDQPEPPAVAPPTPASPEAADTQTAPPPLSPP